MSVNAAALAKTIDRELNGLGSPERAVAEKKYLKSDLDFYGVTLGDIRKVIKTSQAQQLDRADALRVIEVLWQEPVFERRMSAVLLLERQAGHLRTTDFGLLEKLIRGSHTWALVDGLAANVVGEMALHLRARRVLDRWSRDDDFWIRRSSLLAELKPLKSGLPFEPFALRADAMLDEREFFIRKAIGWVLREMSKARPAEVDAWISPRTNRASGVTMREAVKYLDPSRAAELMMAYRERRPAAPPSETARS